MHHATSALCGFLHSPARVGFSHHAITGFPSSPIDFCATLGARVSDGAAPTRPFGVVGATAIPHNAYGRTKRQTVLIHLFINLFQSFHEVMSTSRRGLIDEIQISVVDTGKPVSASSVHSILNAFIGSFQFVFLDQFNW
jgi:hypothetical protein